VKRLAKSLILQAQTVSHRRRLTRRLRRQMAVLAEAGELRRYPFDRIKPAIYNSTFYRRGDRGWLDFFYSVHGHASRTFIPNTSYYQVIEPLLNRYDILKAVVDKNSYDRQFPDVITPATPLRRIHGRLFDSNYDPVHPDDQWIRHHLTPLDRVFIKPSIDSGGGKNIIRFERDGSILRAGGKVLDERFLKDYPYDFVLQEAVVQHPFFAQFNSTSNNTLRVFTYRSVTSDDVHTLHTLLRIGGSGSYLDHDNHGGVAIAVTPELRLKHEVIDVNGRKRSELHGIEFRRVGVVPCVSEIQSMARTMSSRIDYGRLVAYDFTVSEAGMPILLDVNCHGNGVSHYQMCNGSIFYDLTQEVLDYCEANLARLPSARLSYIGLG
jgi:hypothetical protein